MTLRKQRGRFQAYENITVGSQVTTFERTAAGSAPPVELSGGRLDNLSVGNPPPTTVIADDIVPGTVTLAGENVAVGG